MHTSMDLCKLSELTDEDRKIWTGFQWADPSTISPYFSFGYHQIVDQVRGGVQVLRFHQDGRPVAYWPFRKSVWGTGRPVGGPMEDMNGLVADPNVTLDLQHPDLGKLLGGYTFASVPFTQRRHGLDGDSGDGSHIIDLYNGYEAWKAERFEQSSTFRRHCRKSEKLMQEPGVEVEHNVVDFDVLDRLIELKRIGYRKAGYFDLFSLGWPQEVLRALLKSEDENAKGVLSILKIDGEVAASCFNMRSKTGMHYWFPGYEDKFHKKRPGLALLYAMSEWAAQQGIVEYNLGRGDMEYKVRFGTWMQPVRGGVVNMAGLQRAATDFTQWTASLEGSNPLLNLPSKVARKCHRAILAGSWRA